LKPDKTDDVDRGASALLILAARKSNLS
jgi:hypothetical protein